MGEMDLWRSEEMQLVQLMVPAELAHDTVASLGEVGLLQFKDLNTDKSAFQRTYANQVKRTDEMARKLRFFADQVEKANLIIGARFGADKEYELDELEAKLEELETELLELNGNMERLQRSYNELLELQLVLERASQFFDDAHHSAAASTYDRAAPADADDPGAPLLSAPELVVEPKTVRLGFVAGLIPQEKLQPFERLLFRATRGNMYLKYVPVGTVTDPNTGEKVEKSVFVVFFAGERARTKILKICEAYGANRYPFPEEGNRQLQMNAEVTARLRELMTTIDAGTRQRENLLQSIALNLEAWSTQVKHEKAVYHTLNKFSVDVTRKVLVAEAWLPAKARPRAQEALRLVSHQSNSNVEVIFTPLITYEHPPTYFETNKVTYAFQEIVEAYGIARYREVNPTVFTIVTFPFLFAVMFGDVGHASLMLITALYLVLNERALGKGSLGDMFDMIFGGRYVILLMSIFSIFTGLIYNEAFSIPLSVFGGTQFRCPSDPSLPILDIKTNPESCPEAYSSGLAFSGTPYPLGVDPIWHGTKSELPYLNSLKMKMSILIGVAQMNLGILMSLFNQRYFRDSLSMWCEFVPQMIFMNALFGYLCFLIVLKWVSGSTADLYHILIYMFLSPGDVDCGGTCTANILFPGQAIVQVVLVLLALIAVPWMLVPKPYILRKRHLQRMGRGPNYGRLHDEEDEEAVGLVEHGEGGGGGGHGGHGEEFDFGEIAVHQMIHTIEFVLGAVSNTASYLRLWALSLAHSQLSAVFFDRVMVTCINMGATSGTTWALFIGFFVFACATLGVLMVMETLSAFLHALRLHWVEFQNKFYHGDGYKFAPFSFAVIDKEEL